MIWQEKSRNKAASGAKLHFGPQKPQNGPGGVKKGVSPARKTAINR